MDQLTHIPEHMRPVAAAAIDQLAAGGWVIGLRGRSADGGSVLIDVDGQMWQVSLVFAPVPSPKATVAFMRGWPSLDEEEAEAERAEQRASSARDELIARAAARGHRAEATAYFAEKEQRETAAGDLRPEEQ